MKYLFTIAFLWLLFFEACEKDTNEHAVKSPEEKTSLVQQSELDRTFDSLSNELGCRVSLSEEQLNQLKKKRWPNSEKIAPVRSIDPVYYNSKTNNPPE